MAEGEQNSSSGAVPGSRSSTTPLSTSQPFIQSWTALAGVSILKGQAAPALAVRAEGPFDFSAELGGTLPHPVAGYASAESLGNADHTESFAETHVALLHPLYGTGRLEINIGAGISFGVVSDRLDETAPPPTSYRDRKFLPGPLVMLGASYPLTDHLSVFTDLSYVDYINHISYGLQTFNLTFSGVMIRPGVEWRF